MSDQTEHSVLLLKVITHDLLSPLTAAKWYAELLTQGGVAASKHREYLQGIADAANLGISITKHVHIAGKVLTHAYKPELSSLMVPAEVRKAIQDLTPQYARHGVALTVEVDEEAQERVADPDLIRLMVWACAKYFLTAAPAGSTVSFRGLAAPTGEGASYTLLVSLPGVPDREERVRQFTSHEPAGTLDQAYVFSELMHSIAPLLGVSLSLGSQGTMLVAEVAFPAAY